MKKMQLKHGAVCLIAGLLTAVLALTGVCAEPVKQAKLRLKIGAKAPMFVCPLFPVAKKVNVALCDELSKGNVVVLSFIYTKCKPVDVMYPRLASVIGKQVGKPVSAYLVFVGNEDEATLEKWLVGLGVKMPVLMDPEGYRIGEPYKVVRDGIANVPRVIAIDKKGVIRGEWIGFPEKTEEELDSLLAVLVDEVGVVSPAGK